MEENIVEKKKREYEVVETLGIPIGHSNIIDNCKIIIEKDKSNILYVYDESDRLIGTAHSLRSLAILLGEIDEYIWSAHPIEFIKKD